MKKVASVTTIGKIDEKFIGFYIFLCMVLVGMEVMGEHRNK